MGIVNVTPDSFYNKSRYTSDNLLKKVKSFIDEGADIIDIGGFSSRPGAADVSESDELKRVIPAIESITNNFPNIPISIDTFRSKVAIEACNVGACMINDISGGDADLKMFETVADLKVPYVLMHMRGTPKTMSQLTNYDDLLGEIILYFSEKISKLTSYGVNDIILDPGFGFAKDIEQNYHLLDNLKDLEILNLPILAGVSRKSMIYKTLDVSAEDALNGTTVLNTIALINGAKILRVHDVKQAKETINLVTFMRSK